jgi:tRNA U34 5-carboxymethylaminomethyl modifying enzyme MnmG/GidA
MSTSIENLRRLAERDVKDHTALFDLYVTVGRDIDYLSIPLLRVEARQKLAAIRPRTLGQAGRISGVSPADIGGLIVWLSNNGEKHV